MSNWDDVLDAAKDGVLPTMLPADLKIPMVAPDDLGTAAARHLLEPPRDHDVYYVEGPQRYSPQDVANAFAVALGHSVTVEVTPHRKLGFSVGVLSANDRRQCR
jgi:uncharacterized protein YbjT (DUF2867 family)